MSKKVQTPTDNDVEGVILIDPGTGLPYGDGDSVGKSPVSLSGTITTGGTAQVLSALKTVPRKFSLRNTSVGTLYISSTGTATTSSMPIKADEYYESPYSTINVISIFGATTGQAFFGNVQLQQMTQQCTMYGMLQQQEALLSTLMQQQQQKLELILV